MPKPPSPLALIRYQAISAYLSLEPPRGQRQAVLEKLAEKLWTLPDGRQRRFAAETLRTWVRRYRNGGLPALDDKPRPRPGIQVLTPEQVELVCAMKREVPARSLERIIEIAEETGLLPSGLLTRSTLHRLLQRHGLSKRPRKESTTLDLDRFEAELPNDLWQSDMMAGPWLPDPSNPKKRRRAWLHAFLDDHSRLLLAGRFFFGSDLPGLEITFREALRRHGVPKRVYYDNGGPYRSRHMAQVVAVLGIHARVFTQPYRPEGHGKIEAFNRLCRAAFVEEVRASSITTLDRLNRAFRAWVDHSYNRRVHSETAQSPWERWRCGAHAITHVDERQLVDAFLFRTKRTTDKTGVLKLHGHRFQTSAALARKRVEVRYDPERMDQIEIWRDDQFQERVGPLEITAQRRPVTLDTEPEAPEAPSERVVDWLGHLIEGHDVPPLQDAVELALAERQEQDRQVTDLLKDRLSPDAFDETAVLEFLERFGPFEPEGVEEALALAIELGGTDQHVTVLLHEIRRALEAS